MMEPLEQVTVVMTLMQRLVQVMDHERAILKSLRLDVLPELQEEKAALAEAYEIEIDRLRRTPERLATLEPPVRERLHDAMRGFQEAGARNLDALLAAQTVVDKILRNIADNLARAGSGSGYGVRGQAPAGDGRGQVIPVAFDRHA
jgi:flagellar biosynthesis/type III secretory pathway chaperone